MNYLKETIDQPGAVTDRRRHLLLISPMAVIAAGQLAAWITGPTAGTWVWAYLFMGYWISLAGLILWGGGREAVSRWLQPSKGSLLWPGIAVAFAFGTTLWIAIPNWRILLQPELLVPTFIFALVNPWLEEGYWRGLIIDAAARWPKWVAILYSGGLSAINHLFVMVITIAARNPAVWAYQLVLGLLMGVVYTKTSSLRWPIASHAVINMLSLSAAMFLNVFVPDQPR